MIHGESNVWNAAQILTDEFCVLAGFEGNYRSVGYGKRWYGNVLRREDGHVLRRALDFEAEGQRKKGRMLKTQVEA